MKRLLFIAVLAVTLAGCGRDAREETVVARVNGHAITQTVWDAAVTDLERSTNAVLDDAARRKVLESLVQSELMAHAGANLLDADDHATIDAQVKLHRDRLLVKEYLRRVAEPTPITVENIQDYYAAHPESFGAGEQRRFELLTTEAAPPAAQRTAVLDAMNALRGRDDWNTPPAIDGVRWVRRLESDGNQALDVRIRNLAAGLTEGEASGTLFIAGRPYLLRVTRIETREPRSLTEVRTDILRRLQIEQLQRAVDLAAQELLSQAEVEYLVPMNENE